jgi:hypothetical protein
MKPTAAYRRREQQLKPTKPELHTQNNNNNTNNLSTSAPYSLHRPITQKEKEQKKAIDHISVALLHKCTTTATKCKCKRSMVL